MKAIVYVRVSDARQVENTSLESQEEICRQWCATRGIAVDRVFKDAGESAKTADRPAFQEMIRYTERNNGKLSFCIVYRFNRFSRSAYDYHQYAKLLADRKIRVKSVCEPTDDSPMGNFFAGMLSEWSQFDNETRSQNTTQAMRQRVQAGYWVWRAPLGYLTKPKQGVTPATLVIDPVQGPLIRQAFERIAEGYQDKVRVLKELTSCGLKTAKGRPLNPQSFNRLLRNPVYAGRIVAEGWGLDVQGKFEPLVSEEIFHRAQAVLDGKALPKTPHRRVNEAFPLRGLLLCATCKHPLTASKSTGKLGGKFPYYRCTRGHLNLPAAKVEAMFLALLDDLKPDADRFALVKAIFKDVWGRRHASIDSALRNLQKKKGELKEQKHRLLEGKLKGEIADDDYREFNERLKTELAAVESELFDMQRQEVDIDTALDYVEFLIWNTRSLWLDASFEAKTRIQNAIFPNKLSISKEGLGTPIDTCFFNILRGSEEHEVSLASPRGFEPLLSP